MKKAFTITELLLAISLMVVLIATSGVVFRTAVKAHRTASATAEIARKLRGITDQLNADFKGLRKDGEIFITWVPNGVDDDGDGTIDRYERIDRIMFFADGDFQSYKEWPPTGVIHGDVARISYMLAKDKNGNKAQLQAPGDRVLARSQHIFAADPDLVDDPGLPLPRTIPINPAAIPIIFTEADNNNYEYNNLLLDEWLNIPWIDKRLMLTVISDVSVDGSGADGGLVVDTETKPPVNVHQLLAEGVGSFSVQGWYAPQQRWVPEMDPDGDGNLSDSDFRVDGTWVLYPYIDLPTGPRGEVRLAPGSTIPWYDQLLIDEANFNSIPGLGRALKFTFTLYDSRGVFKEGKKFTHIVYLDD